MKYVFVGVALLLSWTTATAQVSIKGDQIPAFFERMPSLPSTLDEAYKAMYPKSKKPPYQRYQDSLAAAINTLAVEAAGKSYLLMAMADRMRQDNNKFDRIHNQLPSDKDLENRMNAINSSFFTESNAWTRNLGNAYDSISKLNYPSIERAGLHLQLYQKEMVHYLKKVKQILLETNAYMNKRGFNAILDNHDSSNKYYIQLLEVRGLMYDRIQKVLQQVTATWIYAADMVDICKRYPDSCK